MVYPLVILPCAERCLPSPFSGRLSHPVVKQGYKYSRNTGFTLDISCQTSLNLCCFCCCYLLRSAASSFERCNDDISKGGCGVSFSGDIQDPPGQGPGQPAVGDPASAGRLDWVTHRGPFQP